MLRKIIGIVSGATATAKLAKGVGSDIQRVGDHVSTIWQRATRPESAGLTLPADMSPEGRFRAAMDRYRRTEGDLQAMRTATARSAFLMAVLTLASVLAIAWLFQAFPVDSGVTGAARMTFPLVPAAFALRSAYINYSIRNGRLDPFVDFLKSGDFLPRP